jgi:hypothetical protein
VGDVVEFELDSTGGTYQGMAFVDYGDLYGIAFNLDGKGKLNGYDYTHLSHCKNVRKIGHTQHSGRSINDAKRTAKAYFYAQTSDKAGFKVGDKVEIVKEFYPYHPVGSKLVIDRVDSCGDFWIDGSCYNPVREIEYIKVTPQELASFTPDPALSYADNQAAWIEYHGLSDGDEVRVTRKFKRNEAGFDGEAWDHYSDKAESQGSLRTIGSINNRNISVTNAGYFPYFALEPVK